MQGPEREPRLQEPRALLCGHHPWVQNCSKLQTTELKGKRWGGDTAMISSTTHVQSTQRDRRTRLGRTEGGSCGVQSFFGGGGENSSQIRLW